MLTKPWNEIRTKVREDRQVLSPEVFERIVILYDAQYARANASLQQLTAEWESREFLRVVGSDGKAVHSTESMLRTYEGMAQQSPEFRHWFQPAVLQNGIEAGVTLLAARWLCHLVGFRHLTVEIFIDPPFPPGFTLAQVRGMEKFEAPGCFDIPCAGHISEMQGVAESLEKELGEELNLSRADLVGIALLSEYESIPHNLESSPALNFEYRYLFKARLKEGSTSRIRFTDGEVAGLCVFAVSELRSLVSRFPERVASGLSDAVAYYRGAGEDA